MPFNLQSIRMQRIRLIAISHGIEGSLFSLSCRIGSLITSIFYGKRFPVALVSVSLTCSVRIIVVSFHSSNEV